MHRRYGFFIISRKEKENEKDSRKCFGVDRKYANLKIEPIGAIIEKHFFIDHGTGIVIGKNVTIKGNAFITESVKSLSKE